MPQGTTSKNGAQAMIIFKNRDFASPSASRDSGHCVIIFAKGRLFSNGRQDAASVGRMVAVQLLASPEARTN